MRIVFSEFAKLEMDDAASFYELQFEGLGDSFKSEVRKAALRIADYPRAWSPGRGEVRKCLLHRFPFSILYSIEPDHIFSIAGRIIGLNADDWRLRERPAEFSKAR